MILHSINSCGLQAKEVDSLLLFDEAVSYQSELSNQEQIVITKQAERYAREKGNVYKALSYACVRGKLFFLSDHSDSCEQLYAWLIPEVEKEMLPVNEKGLSKTGRRRQDGSDYGRETGKQDRSLQWKILLVDCYINKALNLMYLGKSDSSLQIYQQLLQRFEKDSIPLIDAKCLNGMGIVFANSNLNDMAVKYLEMALQKFVLAGDPHGIFGVCSNIVAFYSTQGLFEEALPYGLRSYRIAHEEKYNGHEQIYASLIMASIYSGMKQYGMADTYYEKAFLLAREKNLSHLEGFCGADYAKNLFYMQEYAKAKEVAESTLRLIAGKRKFALQADLLMVLSNIAERQNEPRQSLVYLRKYIQIKDSLNEVDNVRQLIYAGVQYTQDQREEEDKIKEKAFRDVAGRARVRGIWIIVLSILSVLSLSGLVITVFLLVKGKHRMQMLRKETQHQISDAEHQVINKSKELSTYALRFLKLNTLQESILKELKTLKTAFTLRGKEKAIVCNLEEMARQIGSDKEWKDFQFYFEQVDSGFMRKLTERYPDLSANEKHLCVLFKLGLTNRDVANLTGRSLQSIGMAKFRLKIKFNLDNSDEMDKFLREL